MMSHALRAIAVLAFCASGSAGQAYLTDGYAGKFVLHAEQIGANTWSYALTNNHDWIDVIDWMLCWNPTDPDDDRNQALANFDSATGYVGPFPAGWSDVAGYSPYYYAYIRDMAVRHGGNTLRGFKLKYKGTSLPQWFAISYWEGADYKTSPMMPIPEPSGLLAICSGAIGLGGWIGRRRR